MIGLTISPDFGPGAEPFSLSTLLSMDIEQGVMMHRYAIRDLSEASPC
jgi:hypothetical protein